MLEEVGGAQRRRVEAASHALELCIKGYGDQRSWAGAAGRPVHMALGESRPGVACSAHPGGWGQHHYFEVRNDAAALRSEKIGACSGDFKRFGVVGPSCSSVR